MTLYFLSLLFVLLGNYGFYKTNNVIGAFPSPDGNAWLFYNLFGGVLATVGIIAILIVGFFVYSWWVPFLVLVFASILVGFIYLSLPLGATYAIFGFPLGVISFLIFCYFEYLRF